MRTVVASSGQTDPAQAPTPSDEIRREESGSSAAPKIAVRNIRKEFAAGSRQHVVFDGLSFDIADGEFVVLIGPSGCGKTTMLNIIAGLTAPSAGEVLVGGKPVTGPGAERGMIFQQDAILMWRTVRKNVEYGLEIKGLSSQERRRRGEEYMRLVHLEKFADFYPKQLSGGMKKRVAIATVLANEPEVLLLDEPFGSLDYPSRIRLQDELLRLWAQRATTTVFVTHDIEEALYLADRVLVLVDGRLVEDVRVPFERPRSPELRTSAEMQVQKSRLWKYM
jgi:NitT/TauT family transport system ATP-binding protein